MPAVTIRNLSDATHRALKVRAAQHGRSAEAEMRDILEMAVRPDTRLRLGTALAEVEQRVLEETLRIAKGNKALAARILKIDPTTVFRKLRAGEADKAGDERGGAGRGGA